MRNFTLRMTEGFNLTASGQNDAIEKAGQVLVDSGAVAPNE